MTLRYLVEWIYVGKGLGYERSASFGNGILSSAWKGTQFVVVKSTSSRIIEVEMSGNDGGAQREG